MASVKVKLFREITYLELFEVEVEASSKEAACDQARAYASRLPPGSESIKESGYSESGPWRIGEVSQ